MSVVVGELVYDGVFQFVAEFLGFLTSLGIPIDEFYGNFEFILLSPLIFVFLVGMIFLPFKLFNFLVEVIF